MTVAMVLLAAGGGTRFAGPTHKLLADLHGRPVLAHALDAVIQAGPDELIVVTGAADVVDILGAVDAELTVLHNPDWERGIASSLALAVEHADRAGHDAVVVGLGDQPFIEPSAWRAVADSEHEIAVAAYGVRRRNPVRLGRSVWHLLPTSGDDGARAVMQSRPELVHPVACDGFPDDIDTVEDLRRWS